MAAALQAGGLAVELARTSGPGTARQLAQAAATQGNRQVVVCGGDGTINEVINGIAPGPTPLGILPGGTANIIAKELGLAHDPVRAARELSYWSPRRIALGMASWTPKCTEDAHVGTPMNLPEGALDTVGRDPVQRRYFLSVAGIGFDAYIVHQLSPALKISLGSVAYGLEALRQVVRYSFPFIICRVESRELRATFAVLHRTRRYAGWFHLAPSADVFDARFSLCAFKSHNRARYFLYAAAAVVRQHLRLVDVELVQGRQIMCTAAETGQPVYFQLDGEFVGEIPATFEIVPDALTLLVPQGTG